MASKQQEQGPVWYDAQFYPDSEAGYVYIIVLDQPYQGGAKQVRIGGHYEMIEGKKRLIGGELQERPQMVYVYIGWSPDPWKRYDKHVAGRGGAHAGLSGLDWGIDDIGSSCAGGQGLRGPVKAPP